jgi:hypothetical protein
MGERLAPPHSGWGHLQRDFMGERAARLQWSLQNRLPRRAWHLHPRCAHLGRIFRTTLAGRRTRFFTRVFAILVPAMVFTLSL